MMIRDFNKLLSCTLIFFSGAALATNNTSLNSTSYLKGFEFSIAAGPSWLQTNDTTLEVSPYQTDSVQVDQIANNVAWKMGVGYDFLAAGSDNTTLFDHFLVELNLYHNSGAFSGDAWEYQLPEFNNYSFRAPVSSTRLMLDFKPSFGSWHDVTPYPIVGFGVAWNRLSYEESVTNADVPTTSYQSLASSTTRNFASEFGAGVRTQVSDHLSLSLEYLYANLGTAKPSSTSNSDAALTSPPLFSVHDQNLLFGLNWAF